MYAKVGAMGVGICLGNTSIIVQAGITGGAIQSRAQKRSAHPIPEWKGQKQVVSRIWGSFPNPW